MSGNENTIVGKKHRFVFYTTRLVLEYTHIFLPRHKSPELQPGFSGVDVHAYTECVPKAYEYPCVINGTCF